MVIDAHVLAGPGIELFNAPWFTAAHLDYIHHGHRHAAHAGNYDGH